MFLFSTDWNPLTYQALSPRSDTSAQTISVQSEPTQYVYSSSSDQSQPGASGRDISGGQPQQRIQVTDQTQPNKYQNAAARDLSQQYGSKNQQPYQQTQYQQLPQNIYATGRDSSQQYHSRDGVDQSEAAKQFVTYGAARQLASSDSQQQQQQKIGGDSGRPSARFYLGNTQGQQTQPQYQQAGRSFSQDAQTSNQFNQQKTVQQNPPMGQSPSNSQISLARQFITTDVDNTVPTNRFSQEMVPKILSSMQKASSMQKSDDNQDNIQVLGRDATIAILTHQDGSNVLLINTTGGIGSTVDIIHQNSSLGQGTQDQWSSNNQHNLQSQSQQVSSLNQQASSNLNQQSQDKKVSVSNQQVQPQKISGFSSGSTGFKSSHAIPLFRQTASQQDIQLASGQQNLPISSGKGIGATHVIFSKNDSLGQSQSNQELSSQTGKDQSQWVVDQWMASRPGSASISKPSGGEWLKAPSSEVNSGGKVYVYDFLAPPVTNEAMLHMFANAVPGKDYPALTDIPETSFNCASKKLAGYYADTETNCQVFRRCDMEGHRTDYKCPEQTVFNQVTLTCDWWFAVDCHR